MANGNGHNGNGRQDPELESALELLGMLGPVAEESFDQAGDVTDEVFSGRPRELSSEDRQRLNTLRDEFQSLTQPQMETRPIGRHIPGNEFSVSTAGLSQGLNQMLRGMETKRRNDELFGDPERRAELQATISKKKEEIDELRSNAEKIRQGILPAETLARLDPMADPENVAASVEQQAEALNEEISLYEQQLNETRGVSSRTQQAEEQAERVDQNRQEANQFRQALGSNLMSGAVQMERDARQAASMERREQTRQDAMTERTRIQQQRILQSQQEKFKNAVETEEYEATEFTPGDYQPPLVKQIVHDTKGQINQQIEDLTRQATKGLSPGMFGEEPTLADGLRKNPQLANQYRELQQSKRYMEMIEQGADAWQRKTFRGDRPPNWRPPSELEEEIMEGMLDSNYMHPELVQAWLHYNEIDPTAPPAPLEAPEGREPGSYGRD